MKNLFIAFMLAILTLTFGCSTGVVAPGTMILIVKTDGPTEIVRNGKWSAWGRDRVYSIDMKLKTFPEKMKILCKDDVNMLVDVKWKGSFIAKTDKHVEIIKTKVPSTMAEIDGENVHILSLPKFYLAAIQDIVRSNTRMIVSPYITDNIPKNREKIEIAVKQRILKRLEELNFPIETMDVTISNLDYDPIVTEQRQAIKKAQLEDERKAAIAKAEVAQAKRNADLARENGKAKIETAKANATANKIVQKSLTEEILQQQFFEAVKIMSAGPNNQLMIIPYSAMGNVGEYLNRQSLTSRGVK